MNTQSTSAQQVDLTNLETLLKALVSLLRVGTLFRQTLSCNRQHLQSSGSFLEILTSTDWTRPPTWSPLRQHAAANALEATGTSETIDEWQVAAIFWKRPPSPDMFSVQLLETHAMLCGSVWYASRQIALLTVLVLYALHTHNIVFECI